jgi:signal peptidase I
MTTVPDPTPGVPVAAAAASSVDRSTAADRPADPAARRGKGGKGGKGGVSAFLEWVVVIVAAVGVALLIKTFVMQAFYIPSESMLPTLEKNDRVLVNKLSYRLHDVNRGDLIVFEKPAEGGAVDGTSDLIKRVIALPGENLVIEGGKVFIDGRQLDEPYLAPGTVTTQGSRSCTATDPCQIPADSVWVMGDNRPNSRDSRFIGAIPEERIVGRAFFRIWPFNRLGGL